MSEQKKPLGYLGGDIMSFGSNLAREYEYEQFKKAGIPGEVYSPVMNKSINDKSNMTEEENNHLAEKICEADIERLWNSDYTVLCPEQSAIGTMCEMGVLYGWKYMADKLLGLLADMPIESTNGQESEEDRYKRIAYYFNDVLLKLYKELKRISDKKNYAHYFDIRTNHLNEKDWRRSFSINQMLYGMILYATADHTLHNKFDEIIPLLQKEYAESEEKDLGSDWR